MPFSRKFLIGSLVVVLAGFVFWGLASANGWFEGDVPETAEAQSDENGGDEDPEDSEEDAKQDKLTSAFKSLDKKMGGKETPIAVEAGPVRRGPLIQNVSSQGRVHGYLQVDVVNEVAGKLVKLHVRDGANVKKGQILAEIDDREYRLDFEDAKSKYLAAKADYVAFDQTVGENEKKQESQQQSRQQLEEQHDKGLISDSDYRRKNLALELEEVRSGNLRDDVIAAKFLDQAWVALEKARLRLEKCQVIAPFNGIIFEVSVSQGAVLNAATKLARLVNLNDVVIKAKVLESEIAQVSAGRPAKIKFTALPGLGEIDGEIQAVSPIVNEQDKTVETIVRFKNVDQRIRPGMFAEVRIDSKIYEDRLMVPKLAILPRDDRKVVFKVGEDKRAKWIYVQTGVENDQFVEIVEGKLEPGDLVLTDNHFTMGHDTLVKVTIDQ